MQKDSLFLCPLLLVLIISAAFLIAIEHGKEAEEAGVYLLTMPAEFWDGCISILCFHLGPCRQSDFDPVFYKLTAHPSQ